MKKFCILFLLCPFCALHAQTAQTALDTTKAIEEIKRLYAFEEQLTLTQDTARIKQYYPDDFVVTNPFNQFIDKKKVIERVKANIIKYSTYKHTFDAFRFYGDMVIVIGSETVVPTADAVRNDAGKTVHRRFTEVWIMRDNKWQKVVRHASNIVGE